MTAVADDRDQAALGGADAEAPEQETHGVAGALGEGADAGASGSTGAGERAASTAAAASIVNEQVKEGKIKIEGEADTAAPP